MRPMHTPPSAIESTEPQAAQGRPHTCFILPELLPTRFDALAILILAYGNRRSSPNGGYAGGARRVVAIAEHLARRPDVAVMVACILSPDNVAKRGDRFFAALYEEFLQLGADVEDHGALVGAGVRVEVSGDLGSLRARGGRAVKLTDAIEAVADMTAHVGSPSLRLILGVGYGRDIARELRTLLHLAEVSSSIGAGLLFRTAALAAPSSSVPDGSIAVLEAAAKLLDYQVRLSNDASGFLGSPGGDRDAKENACTILVPSSASGAAREAAIMRALATRLRLASWLGGQVGGQVDRVAAAWPSMGALFRRGALVGRRVYEVAHYTTVTRAQMSAIFDEAEAALR